MDHQGAEGVTAHVGNLAEAVEAAVVEGVRHGQPLDRLQLVDRGIVFLGEFRCAKKRLSFGLSCFFSSTKN